MARIYRFHDTVAVTIRDRSTMYFDPETATDIASAMKQCAEDIGKCKFTKSTLGTVEVNDK